jgi:hypothetical protein
LKKSALHARQIYSALLYLYPAGFRREYARELTLLFVDMYRAAAAQGVRALVGLWLAVLLDVVSSAVRERMQTMFNPMATAVRIQKWGGLASFLLPVALLFAFGIHLTGNLGDYRGPLAYDVADFLYGPVWAASLVTAVYALRERIGEHTPRRMNLALLASFAAALAFVAVACIRSANRHYHLDHPELHLEESSTVLIVWTTLVAGVSATGWHFLGWSLVLIGSAGWTTRLLPRALSALYLLAGTASLFVYLLPSTVAEGPALVLLLVVSIWQGILLWKARSGETQAPEKEASLPDPG